MLTNQTNILTFDVEGGNQGFIKRGYPGSEKFDLTEEKNVNIILELLSKHKSTATFFILANFAKKNQSLIKIIHHEGHEIASHSYSHIVVPELSPDEFREDIRKSKNILENIIGDSVIGYRAPKWSINKSCLWALRVLAEEGYIYDSSVFPSSFHGFGSSNYLQYPFKFVGDNFTINEFPAQTVNICGIILPVAGGFYFRLFPYLLSRYALKQSNKKFHYSMIYLHPYELEIDPPKIKTDLLFKFIRYYNLEKTGKYLEKLLGDFKFTDIKSVMQSLEEDLHIKENKLGGD